MRRCAIKKQTGHDWRNCGGFLRIAYTLYVARSERVFGRWGPGYKRWFHMTCWGCVEIF
jgi:hypothetical protein